MNDRIMTQEVRAARERLTLLGRWYASRPRGTSLAEIADLVSVDAELERVARTARIDLWAEVERRAGPFRTEHLSAILEVPRERFVRPEDIAESCLDTPLLLHDEGLATVSAPHAYLMSFQALRLGRGDRLAELGTGSGYGAALASHVVGRGGAVLTIEIDDVLARHATRLLRGCENVQVLSGDAGLLVDAWRGYERVTVTFSVESVPEPWLDALPKGGIMVVPVGPDPTQRLMRVERRLDGSLGWTDHGAVRYVPNRGRTTAL